MQGITSSVRQASLLSPRKLVSAPRGWDRHSARPCCRSKQKRKHFIDVDESAPPPTIDYLQRLQNWRSFEPQDACPPLFLAPMENLADRPFRRSIAAATGGFDEACTEFMRAPGRADHGHMTAIVSGVTCLYNARELQTTPLGAQLMGSDAAVLQSCAAHLAHVQHAPRVDLNCGCPANTVTGHGAGSSLLKTPELVHELVSAMVQGVGGKALVTVKMRAGFLDASLLDENLLAAQEAGAAFVTLHPRTKVQGYDGLANWAHIARAKSLLKIPVIGNGDVVSADAALRIVRETGCDGVMVGRGAVQDPLIFHRIRAAFTGQPVPWEQDGMSELDLLEAFLRTFAGHIFATEITSDVVMRRKFGKVKGVLRYVLSHGQALAAVRHKLLRTQHQDMHAEEFVDAAVAGLREHWHFGRLQDQVLVNHMKNQDDKLVARENIECAVAASCA